MNHIKLEQVPHSHPDFLSLCQELDSFLNQAIGGECKREKYKKFNHIDTMDVVIIAYDGDTAVGCAALRKYSATEIEVKRVFVCESHRCTGIGGMLMEYLISTAKELGYTQMILETGEFLDTSIRLYERYGFEKIPNYGAYKDMTESLCMGYRI